MADAVSTPDSLDASRVMKTSKWSRDAWIAAYAKHGTVTAACKVVGIARETAYQARKVEPLFAEAWEREENAVTDLLEKTLVEVALEGTGSPQVRALEFALKARKPGMYRETMKHEHGGKVTHAVEEGVDAEIQAALAEVDRLRDRLAEQEPPGQAETAGGPAGEQVA